MRRPLRSGEFNRRTVWWFIVSILRRSELRVGLDSRRAAAAAVAASLTLSWRGGLLRPRPARPVGLLEPNRAGLPSRCCRRCCVPPRPLPRGGLPSRCEAIVAFAAPLRLFLFRPEDGVTGTPARCASTCKMHSTSVAFGVSPSRALSISPSETLHCLARSSAPASRMQPMVVSPYAQANAKKETRDEKSTR